MAKFKVDDKVVMVAEQCVYGLDRERFFDKCKAQGYAVITISSYEGEEGKVRVVFPDSGCWAMHEDELEFYNKKGEEKMAEKKNVLASIMDEDTELLYEEVLDDRGNIMFGDVRIQRAILEVIRGPLLKILKTEKEEE